MRKLPKRPRKKRQRGRRQKSRSRPLRLCRRRPRSRSHHRPQATLRPPKLLQLHQRLRRRQRPSKCPPLRQLRLPLRLRLRSSPLHLAAPPLSVCPRRRSLLRQCRRPRPPRLLDPRHQHRVRDRARLPGSLTPSDLRREDRPRCVRLRLVHSRLQLDLQRV